jgi:hypothetical protein
MIDIFTGLRAQIRTVPVVTAVGRVAAVTGGTVRIKGLDHLAAQGDRLRIGRTAGEVLQLSPDGLVALMEGPVEGLTINTKAELIGAVQIAPDNSWIGRIIDPYGRPLDDRPLLPGATPRRLTSTPPPAAQRRKLGERLETGVAVFDTLLPIVRGQRIGLFAGSGVGKSTLLAKLARGVSADITVIALIGERGRELREFTEHVLGPSGMARSVIVAATSDQSALTRRRCASTAMAVAEHFRDQGLHVLLLADSRDLPKRTVKSHWRQARARHCVDFRPRSPRPSWVLQNAPDPDRSLRAISRRSFQSLSRDPIWTSRWPISSAGSLTVTLFSIAKLRSAVDFRRLICCDLFPAVCPTPRAPMKTTSSQRHAGFWEHGNSPNSWCKPGFMQPGLILRLTPLCGFGPHLTGSWQKTHPLTGSREVFAGYGPLWPYEAVDDADRVEISA